MLRPPPCATTLRRSGVAREARIIPTTDALADVAADLPEAIGPGYESRLREVLEPLRERFDVILLDTPRPRHIAGLALLAADGLLIPALAADLDVRGAGKVYDLVETQLPDLRILGVLVAASESRWRITREAVDRMTTDSMRVLPVWVPRSVRVASAPRHHAPTAVLEPDSMVTHAYRKIVGHLVEESGYEHRTDHAIGAPANDPGMVSMASDRQEAAPADEQGMNRGSEYGGSGGSTRWS